MKSYRITIKGREYEVTVGDVSSSPVTVTVDGEEYQVEIPGQTPAASSPRPSAPKQPPRRQALPSAPRPSAASASGGGAGTIRALMPGRVISISVSQGDSVSEGQAVLVMESMKMENTITAISDGVVTSVLVAEGDSVQHGQTLIEIGPG